MAVVAGVCDSVADRGSADEFALSPGGVGRIRDEALRLVRTVVEAMPVRRGRRRHE